MKILITGKNGFIGKSIRDLPFTDITFVGRNEVDLTNTDDVKKFFSDKAFDIVIHTAKIGGNRLLRDEADVTDSNLRMFFNLLRNKNKFTRFINLSTGAERDRFTDNIIESDYPTDPYGMSKSIISKYCRDLNNFYNIRIFNVFGSQELPTRFIKNNIENYLHDRDIIIHKDRLMDFFFIDDLVSLLAFYITEPVANLQKEIDCSYKQKYTLLDIAKKINNLSNKTVNINLLSLDLDRPYIGDSSTLENTSLELFGLDYGLKIVYNNLSKQL